MPKAITINHVEGKPGKVYYPLSLDTVETPTPGPNDLIIEIHAAALNHRDFFLRQALYPGLTFDVPLLADGYGLVTGTGTSPTARSLLNKKVILSPIRGWESSPEGPETPNGPAILGGTKTCPIGTLQEIVCVDAGEVEVVPEHLSSEEAAALPLTGLTGWRALNTKSGNNVAGRNILVTGIGGGVALNVLQFAVAGGLKVWVTSGNEEKIQKAKELGAAGGVNYRNENWGKDLVKMLPKDRPFIDAVIDGAGGDIITKSTKFLKQGGVIVQYGMTVSPKMDWLMSANLRNIELKGSTMGSREEFAEMVAFVRENKIKPVVSRVVKGLDNLKEIDGLFEDMREGKQFGKLVIVVKEEGAGGSKL